MIAKINLFNKLFNIGDTLTVIDDFGNPHQRTLKSKAWLLGNHTPVAIFSDIGTYNLDRVKLKKNLTK